MQADPYISLTKALATVGLTAQQSRPDQLIVSTQQGPVWPNTGNSFWLSLKQGFWYLSTWLPAVYRIPKEQNICELCAEVPQSSQTAIYRVEEHHVAKYGLERLSEEEADSLFANLL